MKVFVKVIICFVSKWFNVLFKTKKIDLVQKSKNRQASSVFASLCNRTVSFLYVNNMHLWIQRHSVNLLKYNYHDKCM